MIAQAILEKKQYSNSGLKTLMSREKQKQNGRECYFEVARSYKIVTTARNLVQICQQVADCKDSSPR